MSAALRLAPWQIWIVDFGTPVGHEQGGVRPAIVVGSHAHCAFPIDMALVVPLTTRDRGLEHHVRIASRASGLRQPSWARTEEVTAVSTQRFKRPHPIGTASKHEVEELREWLADMIAIAA